MRGTTAATMFTISILLAGSFFVMLTILPVNVRATTLYVGGVGPNNYTTIGEAVRAASPGDTVYVYSGTYNESILIDHTLSLVGEDRDTTVIDSGGTSEVIMVAVDWVNITGFTLTNSGNYGNIRGTSVNNLTIAGNNFVTNATGIDLQISNHNIIINNNVSNGTGPRYIRLISSNNNLVANNTGNIGVGGDNNIIVDNSGQGIGLTASNNNTLIRNRWSKSAVGIWLWDSKYNVIVNNTVSDCSFYGVYINATHNTITGNLIINNSWGVRIAPWFDKGWNKIYHNNMINNTDQAYDNNLTNSWDDGYSSGGNYWSDYNGTDNKSGVNQDQPGSDGIGDTPYNISGLGNKDRYPLMKPVGFSVPLPRGHRFASFPVKVADDRIESVFSSISGCYDYIRWFDSLDPLSPWKSYVPGRATNSLLRLDNTMGFWINMTSTCSLVLPDVRPNSTAISLHRGWNMVGFPSFNTSYTVADMKADIGLVGVRVEAFDPGAAPYYLRRVDDSYLMRAGEGYWVHVPSDVTWNVYG